MLNLIGESMILNGKMLVINVLGNHLPKDNKGYRHCLEVHFEDYEEAKKWYSKGIKITVSEEALKDNPHAGFKSVNFSDCTFEELTKIQVQDEVKKYLEIYAN